MSEPGGEPTRALFEASPCPAILYDAATPPRPDPNAAARVLLEADDGRSAAALATLAVRVRGESEPLRQARLQLPHLPQRVFQARVLPLGGQRSAVLLEDVTEALSRRRALSVWNDAVDRLDAAFFVCGASPTATDARTLKIIASNARAHVLAGVERLEPGARLGEALGDVVTDEDFARLGDLLTRDGHADASQSWRTQRGERVWMCQAWRADGRLSLRMEDVTEKGHLARALSEHARLLRAVNEELDEISFILRQHLRDPARIANTLAERLARRAPADEDGSAQRMLSITAGLARTVDDLTAYIDIGRSPFTGGTVDLDRLLDRTVEGLAPRLEELGVKVQAGRLPMVWGQERLLETLFNALLLNGLRGPRPPGPSTIRLTCERQGDAWRIALLGPPGGASFDPVDAALQQSEQAPAGLGFAICRRIVEHHGGEIGSESIDGDVRVWVELPIVRSLR